MTTTTVYGGYTVPVLGDTDNVPSAMTTYANQIEPRLNKNFASSSARSTALTAAGLTTGTQLKGMRTWLDTPGHEEVHDGTAWHVPQFLEKIVAGGSIALANGGSAPASTAGFILLPGTTVLTVQNSSGGVAFNWPTAFPTGLLTVLLTPGDANVPISFTSLIAQCTSTAWGGIAYNNGTAMTTGQLVRMNYLAIGW